MCHRKLALLATYISMCTYVQLYICVVIFPVVFALFSPISQTIYFCLYFSAILCTRNKKQHNIKHNGEIENLLREDCLIISFAFVQPEISFSTCKRIFVCGR